jgi:hypothetical protein
MVHGTRKYDVYVARAKETVEHIPVDGQWSRKKMVTAIRCPDL